MQPVFQTDFSAAHGNALQACFATIFALDLNDVPNFIRAGADYLAAVDAWLAPRGLAFVKINLAATNGRLEFPAGPALCVLAGPSPRGDYKHAVVARVHASGDVQIGRDFEIVHDPHPDGRGLAGAPVWAGFVVLRAADPDRSQPWP